MPKTNNVSITNTLPIPAQMIRRRIHIIRDQEVMFDSDLAELYQVETRVLNQAVNRNLDRFPPDFMFQLNNKELQNWKSQIVISNPALKMGLRKSPYAFTEHGVAMLSSVLNSKRAVQMNILIIRTFIQFRQMLAENLNLLKRLQKVEGKQNMYDLVLEAITSDMKKLKNPIKTTAIGFEWKTKKLTKQI